MYHKNFKNLTYSELDILIKEFLEELNQCEQIFKNQLAIEQFTPMNEQNRINLEDAYVRLNAARCLQNNIDDQLTYIGDRENDLEKRISSFETNMRGPPYQTPCDFARDDLYNTAVDIKNKLCNMEEFIEESNSITKQYRQEIQNIPFQQIAQLMMKQLELLEGMDSKIDFVKDYTAIVNRKKMQILKKYDIKENIC